MSWPEIFCTCAIEKIIAVFIRCYLLKMCSGALDMRHGVVAWLSIAIRTQLNYSLLEVWKIAQKHNNK